MPTPPNSPNAYYTCDSADTSGSTITDRGSGGHNATLVNSPSSVTGQVAQGIGFNGTNQSISIPGAVSSYIGGGSFTVAFWMLQNSYTSYPAILDSTGGSQLFFSVKSASNLYIQLAGSGGDNIVPTVSFALGVWQHVMIIRSGITNTIYRNNVLIYTGSGGNLTTVSALAVGANISGGGSWFNGSVDEIGFYNYAFNSTQRGDQYAYSGGGGGGSAKPWVYAQAMRRLRGAA